MTKSLEDIAQAMREKGLTRQAVLLESNRGPIYAHALTNLAWINEVSAALGNDLYSELDQAYYALPNAQDRGLDDLLAGIVATPFESKPLNISIPYLFKESFLSEAAQRSERIEDLIKEAGKLIYAELQNYAGSNDDLLFEIYKDADILSKRNPDAQQTQWRHFQRLLDDRATRLYRFLQMAEAGGMVSIVESQISDLAAMLPNNAFKTDDTLEKARYYIGLAQETLKDTNKLTASFKIYFENLQKTTRSRVLGSARTSIEAWLTDTKEEFGAMHPFSEDSLNIYDFDNLSIANLMKLPLSEKGNFVHEFEDWMNTQHERLIGMQQLIAGGQITNPDFNPQSVVQNHAYYPNIPYDQQTLSKLSAIVANLSVEFGNMPDISDLASPSKLRKKRDHTYIFKELPKNPLDVTFGNDSGCCIFVPEKLDELGNGYSVPEYLANDYVKLFALYRTQNGKEQRMGFNLAFEMKDLQTGKNILVVNSLELSRFGIAGGKDTIKALSHHNEKELIRYAQEHKYDGIAMGNHEYNTSVNYSLKRNDIVAQKLILPGFHAPFYSDILAFDRKNNVMLTRPNSLYWLWKNF